MKRVDNSFDLLTFKFYVYDFYNILYMIIKLSPKICRQNKIKNFLEQISNPINSVVDWTDKKHPQNQQNHFAEAYELLRPSSTFLADSIYLKINLIIKVIINFFKNFIYHK
jgi:hypothetical protein